jgi:hypothetical protein
VKDFIEYLKWKPTWMMILVGSILYFLLAQAYVYPTMTFDFSVVFYFTMGKRNRKLWKKEKPQSPEAS